MAKASSSSIFEIEVPARGFEPRTLGLKGMGHRNFVRDAELRNPPHRSHGSPAEAGFCCQSCCQLLDSEHLHGSAVLTESAGPNICFTRKRLQCWRPWP
jgi:hypothetical protein